MNAKGTSPTTVCCFLLLCAVCYGCVRAEPASFVNARDFDSINEAVKTLPSAGGEVYIPAGRYIVSETILLADNVTLRGSGAGTVIRAEGQFDRFLQSHNAYGNEKEFSILFNSKYGHGAVIKNRSVTGNKGIRIYDLCIETDRDHVKYATGILLFKVDNAMIRGLTVKDCGASGVTLLSCRNVKITETDCRNNHNGIYIKGSMDDTREITVTNCTIKNNRWSGIYVNKASDHGSGRLVDGPENITIANNQIYNHMCDTAIKLHGPRYVIITGNRIDRALEAGIETNGATDIICSGNIVTRVDDGMNLAGNGCAIYFGRQLRRANIVLSGNLTTESGIGIWSETIHSSGQQGFVGGVAVTGNVAQGNVAYGLGGAGVRDSSWVGNVSVDNGQHEPLAGQDTAGMLFTASCERLNITGNTIHDGRADPDRIMQSGLIVRGSDMVVNSDNVVSGASVKDLNLYSNKRVYSGMNMTTTEPSLSERGQ